MEYSDNFILNFGKYKGYKIKDISYEYFNQLYKEFYKLPPTNKITEEFLLFIQNKFHFLPRNYILKQTKCDKKLFATERIAKQRLQEVLNKKDHIEKKPIRVYECKECGAWHFTSMEKEIYEINFQEK